MLYKSKDMHESYYLDVKDIKVAENEYDSQIAVVQKQIQDYEEQLRNCER